MQMNFLGKKSAFKKRQELKSKLMQTPADAVAGFDFSVFAVEDNRKEVNS